MPRYNLVNSLLKKNEYVSSAFLAGSGGDVNETPPSRGKLRASVIVGLLCLLVYNANFRAISAGDTLPTRYLPFAILRWHTVLLDPISDLVAQGRTPIMPTYGKSHRRVDLEEAFWVVRLPSGHSVSLYPVTGAVLVAPLYLPAVAYLYATGWNLQRVDLAARIMEKICASLLAAVAAALFFLMLRRQLDPKPSLLLTGAYAFGTTSWMISSQALWQHSLAQLLVVCAMLLLSGPCTRGRAIVAGVVLGLIACTRPPDLIIAATLGVYGLWWAGRRLAWVMVAAEIAPAIPLLIYNLGTVGHYAGAYGLFGNRDFFRYNLFSGIGGLLFSPTKGLFVFSPFLIFLPLGLPRVFRNERMRGLAIAALVAFVLEVLLYAKADWRQGESWGPRWLTDVVPLLVWLVVPAWVAMSKAVRPLFVAAVSAGIVIEAIGAFWYTGASNAAILASNREPHQMSSAWELRNAPFFAELRHARAPFDLTTRVRGVLDAMHTGYGAKGLQIDLDGWALAGQRSPAEIIALLDGHSKASMVTLLARPDVVNTLGVKDPSGWHLEVPVNNLSSGAHVVAIVARTFPRGETHWLTERRFDVPPESGFAFRARIAADTVAARQQPPGYWLTSFTRRPRFDPSGVEMNTYTPAVILDVLAPVAKAAGLEESLERARRFLTRQIEATGLVRYHGLPNAPTIGTLGCKITPDSDDTALAWRIAPTSRPELLAEALQTLAAYRTPSGLYRTWLAPKDRYQCLDPGSDPDPADIGIQMHVFMMLAKADPRSAHALCDSLKRSVDDDRNWVYYKRSPLVPILRQADLREAGCSVQLPAARLKTAVAGQELWVSAARMISGSHTDSAEVRELLEKISADDFLYLRRSPPLLYHNDLSATVPRYYWSDEFGYALWLRLYHKSFGGTK